MNLNFQNLWKKVLIGTVFLTAFSLFLSFSSFGQKNTISVSDFNENLNLGLPAKKSASLFEMNGYEKEFEYISEVVNPENEFQALAFTLNKKEPQNTSVSLLVRSYDEDWTDFEKLKPDEDQSIVFDDNEYYFHPVDLSSAYQYKIILRTDDVSISPIVYSLSVSAIDSREDKPFFESLVSDLNVYEKFNSNF